MWGQVAAVTAQVGTAWVQKRLSSQSGNVSPYFSGNGGYAGKVKTAIENHLNTFSLYASQLPEGSIEAKEYLTIAKPIIDWRGQRNALSGDLMAILNDNGQRLVDTYKARVEPSISNVASTIFDPIKDFFSFLSANPTAEQAYLGVPKTDTVIPITTTPGAGVEQTGFEKFGLPLIIGIGVIGLILIRR